MGVILWDKDGLVLVSTAKKIEVSLLDAEGESKAILYGLQVARDVGFSRFIIETDYLQVIHRWRSGALDLSSLDMLTEDINCLSTFFNLATFSHCNRQVNFVAHAIARLARDLTCENVWMVDVPSQAQMAHALNVLSFLDV